MDYDYQGKNKACSEDRSSAGGAVPQEDGEMAGGIGFAV